MSTTKASLVGKNLSERILMGFNDSTQLGLGWYELEVKKGETFRWTSKEAIAYLTPRPVSRHAFFFIRAAGWHSIDTPSKIGISEPKVTVLLDGDEIFSFVAPSEGFKFMTCVVQNLAPKMRKIREVRVEADRVFVGSDRTHHQRELGVAVSTLGIENEYILRHFAAQLGTSF
jgi:hypothetical protein